MSNSTFTLDQVRSMLSLFLTSTSEKKGEYIMPQVGQTVFVRTVTMHYVGTVRRVEGNSVELSPAAWVADSGRFGEALATGKLSEAEPYKHPAVVNIAASTDWSEWPFTVPSEAI